ncbi:MAG: hypothetical protein J5999_00215 [Oscillospiraceae bacterium]|nr:hypothetical protein [Oscillospiraceae bacterium]
MLKRCVTVDTDEMPGPCQGNCEEINPDLREYIFGGEPNEFTEWHREALKNLILRNNIKNIIIAAGMSMLFLSLIVTFIIKRTMPEWWTIPILFALLIFAIIGGYDLYANSIALKEADKGNLFCFKYEFYGKLRYVIDHEDNSCLYYANLGDFFVMISSMAEPGPYIFGVVINVKGAEHFYLLV